jgi:hypothetical protein
MFFAQQPVHLDLFEVFRAAPFIYLILFTLSLFSLTIWIYSLSTLKISKMMPLPFIRRVKKKLAEKDYEEALEFCQAQSHCTGSILASAL